MWLLRAFIAVLIGVATLQEKQEIDAAMGNNVSLQHHLL